MKEERKAGDPYTDEQKEEVFSKILNLMVVDLMSARKALKLVKLSSATFHKWLNESEDYANRYARAYEERYDGMADEILEIADQENIDGYIDSNGKFQIDGQAIQRSKLKIDARKWIMSKQHPTKYGDKLEVNGKMTNTNKNIELSEKEIVDLNNALEDEY